MTTIHECIEETRREFTNKFPGNGCGKGWGCDNCGGCYDNDISIEDAEAFIHARQLALLEVVVKELERIGEDLGEDSLSRVLYQFKALTTTP